MRPLSFSISLVLATLILASGCQKSTVAEPREQLFSTTYHDVRLGDGVPIDLQLTIRWQRAVSEPGTAVHSDSVLKQILFARSMESLRRVSNEFAPVDSVFSTQREWYSNALKESIMEEVNSTDFDIHEVIVLNIGFPEAFTTALEQISLQELEEQRIEKRNELDLTQAEANKRKAQADGEVAIAQAEAQGRLQAIQARTEENRRRSELARAQTQSEVAQMQATTEADRLRKIKAVEVEKQREIEMIAVDKQRALDQVALEQQLELARLCESNPVYASFLVNRELASNVEIAVLPSGADANVFGGLLQSRLPGKVNNGND